MGACGALCHFFFLRLMPVLVALVAIFVGWICSQPVPEGALFASMFAVMGGYPPAPIFGGYREAGVAEVPPDKRAEPRPQGEMFLPMPSGAKMPANGIGMCCRPLAYNPESVRRTVLWYLLQGGRHIDDADIYWNHQSVGGAIREAEALGVPRSEVFLTTKIFPSFFGKASVNASVHRYLEELGVDYIDLVLMHAPSYFKLFGECKGKTWKECRQETWLALSALRDQGLIRDIGVSNFVVRQLEEIRELKAAPIAANQFEFHPWATDWQQDVFQYCHDHGIAVTAYNSVGGFMQKAKTETVNTMKDIAAAKKKTIPLVLLRWALQKNVSVIPGTGNPRHMRENLDVYGFELTSEEMGRLDALRSDPNRIAFFGLPADET